MRTTLRAGALGLITLLAIAACSAAATPSPVSQPSAAASVAASPSATPNACAAIQTLAAGKLTIGADNPAYPPYFDPDPADPAWELGNPSNGKGFESAVASATAKAMGFTQDQVSWAPVAFNNAIAPGKKAFDLYLTQVSYSAERAQAVDLSDGYFDVNQAVVALKANAISSVTTVAGLKDYKLGAPVGTTSYTYITDNIKPTKEASVYNDLDGAVKALQAKQIDGIVVDLPTAFYMRDAQIDNSTIVGWLPTVGEVEHFSILLSKGSPLTACVNQAVAAIKADGTLAALTQKWIYDQGAPALK